MNYEQMNYEQMKYEQMHYKQIHVEILIKCIFKKSNVAGSDV